ncbi:hypothetical protein B0E42_27500 [Pseudomonas sp. A25(2017)]|nr:hypothetical protein B0E42_27500 [Pseudomonas sp. A25(2017)]
MVFLRFLFMRIDDLRSDMDPCGSEPARDSGVSGNVSIGCYAAIASRLAPTGDSEGWKIALRSGQA